MSSARIDSKRFSSSIPAATSGRGRSSSIRHRFISIGTARSYEQPGRKPGISRPGHALTHPCHTGRVASKYDNYWTGRAADLRAAVLQAASGEPATIDVRDLRLLGQRQSWSGAVVVRGRKAAPAETAHAVSLGRVVAAAGICEPWPDQAFRFAISQRGTLAVTLIGDARSVPPTGPRPGQGIVGAPMVHDTNLRFSAGCVSVGAAAGCSRIHTALAALPLWSHPANVPFTNGLYFFYERGEQSRHAPQGRVVRIGNHPRVQDRLFARLGEHYGASVSIPAFPNAQSTVFGREASEAA